MKILLLFFLIINVPAYLSGSDDYSEFLIEKGDYYRAISELRKKQWEDKSFKNWFSIEKKILSCYQKSGHLAEGINEWESFNKLHHDIVKNHLTQWYLIKSKFYLQSGKYNKIYPLSVTLSQNTQGKEILNFIKKREEILFTPSDNEKSPLVSGILSTILPGAGQWYAGYPGDAIFTFIIVSAFTGGSYYLLSSHSSGVYIVIPITAFFYLGNIYGAVTTTYRTNLLQRYRNWEYYRDQNNFDSLKSISSNNYGLKLVLWKW